MYYLELIERFWIFNQRAKPGSTAIAMYLYLLKTAKGSGAYDFKVSDIVLSKELGLTRQTIRSTKEKLCLLGLIQFQTRNGVAGSYRLILNYPLDASAPEIKNAQVVKRTSENLDNEIIRSSPQLSNENVTIPGVEEFLAYAQTLAAYEPELAVLVEDKFHIWKDNGWKNSSGRLITNWRSSLKSTLPFLKNAVQYDQLSLQTIPEIKRPKSTFGNDQ